ncbi:MAG TPA: hypothetical protein VL069_11870 [Opitutus sp.]|nr:hypothetical protein [Opitutus sp.]
MCCRRVGLMMVLFALTPFVMKPAEPEPEVHIATRLGNPVTRFANPLDSPADLQAMLHSETLREDVDFIARESGFKGDMADLRRAANLQNIRPLQIPVGKRLPAMSTRREGKAVLLREVLWAGKEPIDAYEFFFVSQGRRYPS